jgi:hypothetical protein
VRLTFMSSRIGGLVAVSGITLGLFSRVSDALPREVGWIGNLGAVWLAVAFAVGARTSSRMAAALAGAGTLALATLVHYGSMRILHWTQLDLLRFPVAQWILIGVPLGALYGSLGRRWREPAPGWWTTAVVAAAFGAEALYLSLRNEPNAVVLAVPLELTALALIPLLMSRSARERLHTTIASLVMTPIGAAGILGIASIARRVY